MFNRIKLFYFQVKSWIRSNASFLSFLIFMHFVFNALFSLSYLNLLVVSTSEIYILDYLVFWILFKPKKESVLRIVTYMFVFGFLLALLRLERVLEVVGIIIFLLIATYIILSLGELRKEKTRNEEI